MQSLSSSCATGHDVDDDADNTKKDDDAADDDAADDDDDDDDDDVDDGDDGGGDDDDDGDDNDDDNGDENGDDCDDADLFAFSSCAIRVTVIITCRIVILLFVGTETIVSVPRLLFRMLSLFMRSLPLP